MEGEWEEEDDNATETSDYLETDGDFVETAGDYDGDFMETAGDYNEDFLEVAGDFADVMETQGGLGDYVRRYTAGYLTRGGENRGEGESDEGSSGARVGNQGSSRASRTGRSGDSRGESGDNESEGDGGSSETASFFGRGKKCPRGCQKRYLFLYLFFIVPKFHVILFLTSKMPIYSCM